MGTFVSIGEAAEVLGVSITTLRRWEAEGRLVAEHTPGGH
ncbi:helix-turn-helix domain-containing protein, partial [Rhizobium calliandrae]